MTELKKKAVISFSVAGVFLTAFLAVLIIYFVKQNSNNHDWQAEYFTAVSSIGELQMNYSDYSSGSIKINNQNVKVDRQKSEDSSRCHFFVGDTKYYLIVLFNGQKAVGFLYIDNDTPLFLEKVYFE